MSLYKQPPLLERQTSHHTSSAQIGNPPVGISKIMKPKVKNAFAANASPIGGKEIVI